MEYYDLIQRIEYPVTEIKPSEPDLAPPPAKPSRFWRLLRGQTLAALALCVGILTMKFWWPAGVDTARQWLVCQDIGPLESAAQTFVSKVMEGEPVADAVTAFCQEVLAQTETTAEEVADASH